MDSCSFLGSNLTEEDILTVDAGVVLFIDSMSFISAKTDSIPFVYIMPLTTTLTEHFKCNCR